MQNKRLIVAAIVALVVGSQAMAAVTSYPNRAAWTAAAGPPTGGEDFNGFTVDTVTEMVTVPVQGGTLRSNGVGMTASLINMIDVIPFRFNTYNVDDSPYFLSYPELGHPSVFEYTTPITAWAADFDRGNTTGITTFPRIDAFDASNNLLGTVPIVFAHGVNEIQFYGFTITGGAASRIVLDNSGEFNLVYGVDNVQFVAVPEPSVLAMIGLAAVAVVARRRV